MISIVLGPDQIMARTEVKRIVAERDPDGHGTTSLDGQSTSLHDALMAAANVGFFDTGRVVVVEGLIARFGKGSIDTDGWSKLFNGVPEASTLILLDPAVLSVPAALKKLLPKDATVFLGDPPRGQELIQWIMARAKQAKSSIEPRIARVLAESLFPQGWSAKSNNPAFDRPPDLELLGNEIDKLALAAHPDPIGERMIAEFTPRIENDQVFRFIDAVTSGNVAGAVNELDRLLAVGEEPGKLFAQIATSAELGVVMASAERRAPAEVGKDLKLANANRMTSISRSLGNGPRQLPLHTIQVIETADRRLKTGELRDPLDALHAVIAGVAQKAR